MNHTVRGAEFSGVSDLKDAVAERGGKGADDFNCNRSRSVWGFKGSAWLLEA